MYRCTLAGKESLPVVAAARRPGPCSRFISFIEYGYDTTPTLSGLYTMRTLLGSHRFEVALSSVGAVLFTILAVLWLATANSSALAAEAMAVLKTSLLIVAGAVYVVLVGATATKRNPSWAGRAASVGSASVGLAVMFVAVVSLFWYQGLFHGRPPLGRIPAALPAALIGAVVAGLIAPLVGGAARWLTRPFRL